MFWLRSLSDLIRAAFNSRLLISGSVITTRLTDWQAMANVSSDLFPSLVPTLRMLISSGRHLWARKGNKIHWLSKTNYCDMTFGANKIDKATHNELYMVHMLLTYCIVQVWVPGQVSYQSHCVSL